MKFYFTLSVPFKFRCDIKIFLISRAPKLLGTEGKEKNVVYIFVEQLGFWKCLCFKSRLVY